MDFTQSGGQTTAGPGDWFTGTVYIDGIRNPDDQSAVSCACPASGFVAGPAGCGW